MSHNHGVELFGFGAMGSGSMSVVLWRRSRGLGLASITWLGRYHGWELRLGRLTVEWFKKESKEEMR